MTDHHGVVADALRPAWRLLRQAFDRCGTAVKDVVDEPYNVSASGAWATGHYTATMEWWRDARVQRFPDAMMQLLCAEPAYFRECSALGPGDLSETCVLRFIVMGPQAIEVAALPFVFAPSPRTGADHTRALQRYVEMSSSFVDLVTPSIVVMVQDARRQPL